METSRRQPDNVLNMPAVDAAGPKPPTAPISEEQVAQRAFELYCERGCRDGHDVEDWLQAERDVRGNATSSAA
jgi:hypothetical protein